MANLQEKPFWEPGIYQLETSDPVLAGPDGIDNLQGKQLANRTVHLKERVDKLESGEQPSGNAAKLSAARKIEITGDGSWNVSFDGSKDVSGQLTLRDSGVAPGDYGMVTVDAKGRVTKARKMGGDDVPAHDWSKISTGKPTTLAGYGIVDGASKDASNRAWANAFRASKGGPASDDAAVGFAFGIDGDTGLFADSLGNAPNTGTDNLSLYIDSAKVFNVYKNGSIWTPAYGALEEKFASKVELKTAVDGIVAGAPGALNTLQEIAAALGNDSNYAATITKQLSSKADKATTLVGYGIADAAGKDQDGRVWGSAFRAKKGGTAGADSSTTGYAFESDGDTGLFATGGLGSNVGTQELQLNIDGQTMLSANKTGLWSGAYGWLHEKFAAKATTLAGYGIVDAASASDLSKVAAKVNNRRMVRVRASGYSVQNGMAGVEIDGVAVGPVARNYNMVQLDAIGTVSRAATFDLAGSSGQDKAAADWLNAVPVGVTVIVYTFDEPQGGRLTGGFPQAMYRCGASSQVFASDKFQYRSAYILIGRAGCGEGQGVERYRGDAPGSTDAQLDVMFELVNGLPLLGSSQINGSVIPAGQIAYFASDKAPTGWLKCDGSYVPKASYASLYAAIQDRFPNPDPKRPNTDPNNLFCLPELRGEFIRSLDDGRGVDAGRLVGAPQAQSIEAHGHGINTIEVFNTAAFIINDNSGDGVVSADNSGPGISNLRTGRYFTERTGGGETRPRNVALLACIKY
ncbi:tail fiber protein [Chromobacterium sp. TRC.1.1.SA]|uniref:Tail fiber protein n=1 Tax=Chromobacterium indicum TaxID=3110228 RepID=A0ABV0CR37_9NEIS